MGLFNTRAHTHVITSRKSEERKRTTNLDDGEPTIEAHQCEEVYGGVHADVCETAVDLWVHVCKNIKQISFNLALN